MCATCGCGETAAPQEHGHPHDHDHGGHDHHHPHEHGGVPHVHAEPQTIRLEQDVLAKNARLAERNRGWLEGQRIVALNLMSSPGAGKTTLLERTIARLGPALALSVIEGDQETLRDAERIRAAGARAVQINTGTGCHLDARMVADGLRALEPARGSLLFIENVGNLVCPALFDLGERARVLIASVTEGDDKPLKYPHMFRACDVLVLNKIDLLPHVSFDRDRFLDSARRINPRARLFQLSATRGDGLDEWCAWLADQARPAAAAR